MSNLTPEQKKAISSGRNYWGHERIETWETPRIEARRVKCLQLLAREEEELRTYERPDYAPKGRKTKTEVNLDASIKTNQEFIAYLDAVLASRKVTG